MDKEHRENASSCIDSININAQSFLEINLQFIVNDFSIFYQSGNSQENILAISNDRFNIGIHL